MTARADPNAGPFPRTAVFDLDGTLVHSLPDIVACLQEALALEGFGSCTEDEVRVRVGRGPRTLVARILEWKLGRPPSDDEVDRVHDRYVWVYQVRGARFTRAYPGASEVLATLRRAGWLLAICTNKPGSQAMETLRVSGLVDQIDALVSGDDEHLLKPDPRVLLVTLARAGGHPSRAVVVGDAATDIAAAAAAGLPSVAVDWGYTDTPAAAFGADRLVHDILDLPEVLDELLPGSDRLPLG
jgi:phosphoglycolate phosphatase